MITIFEPREGNEEEEWISIEFTLFRKKTQNYQQINMGLKVQMMYQKWESPTFWSENEKKEQNVCQSGCK